MKKYNQERSRLKHKKLFSLTRIMPFFNNDIMKLQHEIYKIYFKPDIVSISNVLLKNEVAFNVRSLNVVNTTNGAMMLNNDEMPIFILIPRKKIIDNMKYRKHIYVNALKRMIKNKSCNKRGKMLSSKNISKNKKYTHFGFSPNRGGHGLVMSSLKYDTNNHDYNVFIKQSRIISGIALEYIPSTMLRGLADMCKILQPKTLYTNKKKKHSIWASMACAINYYSAAHIDKDFFLSILSVNVDNEEELQEMSDVVTHFCIPFYGVSIALRDGDLLIFNPQIHHCAAHQEIGLNSDIILCSHYLKSLLVGGNNNDVELSEEQKDYVKDMHKVY